MTSTLPQISKLNMRDVADHEKTKYTVAATRSEREAAFHVIYEAYLKVKLCDYNPFGVRVVPYHVLPTTDIFVAILHREVIGTLTLVRDGELGLPMESVCPDIAERQRSGGLQLAEVCSLATAAEDANRVTHVFELYRLMAQYARHHGVHQIVALIQPRHVNFYRRLMAFQTIGPLQTYPSACNCEVVPMCLDLRDVRRSLPPRAYRRFFGALIPAAQLEPQPMSLADREYFGNIVDQTYHCSTLAAHGERLGAGGNGSSRGGPGQEKVMA